MKFLNKDPREIRFLVLFPFVFIPFLAILFYALGGGRGEASAAIVENKGFNLDIPSAYVSSDETDKLSIYQKSEADSIQRLKQQEMDPFNSKISSKEALDNDSITTDITSPYSNPHRINDWELKKSINKPSDPEVAARQLNRKLVELQKIINDKNIDSQQNKSSPDLDKKSYNPVDPDLDGLLANNINSKNGDPEINQLDGMLEKILDIQHPERVKDKIKTESLKHKGQIYAISKVDSNIIPELMQKSAGLAGDLSNNSGDGFFELKDFSDQNTRNAISAVVHKDQTLISGSTIKLRLTEDIYIDGQLIPNGTFLYGICTLSGERLMINIENLTFNKSIFPVELTVYDSNGMLGIYVPGSLSRDASKQGADQAIQAVSMGALDPSIQAQAAAAGIETVRGLLSKKVKLVKIVVKADHPVLLKTSK